MVLTHTIPSMLVRVMLREYCASLQSHDVEETAIPCNQVGRVGYTINNEVLSTRTLTSMRLSGLAKLSCTPAQHTEMLAVLSSVVVR